ncbi:ABC transporter ATP-binding protein [Geodermatophilus sabuli]|uniref:Amino acid/amide ABC transporter ATP-binding protein 2, HAAT family n=1 Tax=Geodermatophilus sabuli TaxID=1564158 RepID=A0A285EM97_9ACTN|nr:ABC transporter ATP-binding protein [Geodermatophilus sabuli]MBB3083681.1 branched-chain amino acid transport system ATP-binding protein [Geodermatophilus sabuli]SNX99111.1 amino acid/amide ABC transporter ATP-binding protein 2, HAAT family [Geodermatophilus sabuli]
MLEVRGLRSGYKRSTVLQGVDLDVPDGRVVGLLGRNGVGKTTLIHTLMGLVTPSAGSVHLDGADLTGRRPDVVARAGVALVPQGRRVWAPLTVTEHLALAARRGRGRGPWDVPRVIALLPRLGERLRHTAGQLSGGEQQMLAIARALLTNPRLVLMDEPSDGLAPAVVDLIGEAVAGMKAEGVTLVVVEQDLHLAFAVADEIAVMDKGRVVHRSPTLEFRSDSSVAAALLGVA